jgi:glycine/D-amino acid oxidase-like deaminating enzyme
MLTDKMDLRGGRTLWRDSTGATVRVRRKLSTENCDVAVVGGGVSGALIALTLAKAGFDVVVIDRRMPGLGSTAASTAMIQFELDTPLRELSGKIGDHRAARAYRRSFKAAADLKNLVVANKIRCDWRNRDLLLNFHPV